MAAGLLWILDASHQRLAWSRSARSSPTSCRTSSAPRGFVMQSFFIGVGAMVAGDAAARASALVRRRRARRPSGIPLTVQISFYIGAVAFLARGAVDGVHDQRVPAGGHGGLRRHEGGAREASARVRPEILSAIREMPRDDAAARRGAVLHLARPVLHVAVLRAGGRAARVRRGGPEVGRSTTRGAEWGGLLLRDLLDRLLRRRVRPAADRRARRAGRRSMRAVLLCGGAGLLSVWFIHEPVAAPAVDGRRRHRLGVASSSMPYAILAGALPPQPHGRLHGHLQLLHRAAGDPAGR